MTTPTTADLLKYADLQMASEALLANPDGSLRTDLKKALIDGNNHASKFTATQADNFLAHWQVIAQKPNTGTGFSGTLFKCIADDPATGAKVGELVMSFRSTEFIDDAARDNQATNVMEVRANGFAFGQIADMEAWYASLKNTHLIPPGAGFSVTGYSLGGHLATAFNILRREESQALGTANPIQSTYTFNGAGVGELVGAKSLREIITQFDLQRSEGFGGETFTDPKIRAVYDQVRTHLSGGVAPTSADYFLLENAVTSTAQGSQEKVMLREAMARIDKVLGAANLT